MPWVGAEVLLNNMVIPGSLLVGDVLWKCNQETAKGLEWNLIVRLFEVT